MAPFNTSYTSFYWSAIVNIVVSCTVFFSSYLTLNNVVTLKSGLQVTQDHSNWYRSKARYGFLFALHSNYGFILHRFRDKARYWSKIVIFYNPLHSTPPLSGFPSYYYHPVWWGKTRVVGLPDGEKTSKIYITV